MCLVWHYSDVASSDCEFIMIEMMAKTFKYISDSLFQAVKDELDAALYAHSAQPQELFLQSHLVVCLTHTSAPGSLKKHPFFLRFCSQSIYFDFKTFTGDQTAPVPASVPPCLLEVCGKTLR